MTKLRIEAFSDPEFSNRVEDGEFTTLVNPEKYNLRYEIVQNNEQAPGTSNNSPKYNRQPPGQLQFDFIFDRSGVMRDNPTQENGVLDDIEKFKNVTLKYNGSQHKSNYLILRWGSLLFKGTIIDLDLEYKTFKPDGAPIRAVAKATFQEFKEDELRAAEENAQSPDLTHLRTIKQGDTLPLMAYRIYGDSKYYLEVARANGLSNFRKLTVGDQLFFPPLEKVSKQ